MFNNTVKPTDVWSPGMYNILSNTSNLGPTTDTPLYGWVPPLHTTGLYTLVMHQCQCAVALHHITAMGFNIKSLMTNTVFLNQCVIDYISNHFNGNTDPAIVWAASVQTKVLDRNAAKPIFPLIDPPAVPTASGFATAAQMNSGPISTSTVSTHKPDEFASLYRPVGKTGSPLSPSNSSLTNPPTPELEEYTPVMRNNGMGFNPNIHKKRLFTQEEARKTDFNPLFYRKRVWTAKDKAIPGAAFDPGFWTKEQITHATFQEKYKGVTGFKLCDEFHEVKKETLTYDMAYPNDSSTEAIQFDDRFHDLNPTTEFSMDLLRAGKTFDPLFYSKKEYTTTERDNEGAFNLEVHCIAPYNFATNGSHSDYRSQLLALFDIKESQFKSHFKDSGTFDLLHTDPEDKRKTAFLNGLNYLAIDSSHTLNLEQMDHKTFQRSFGLYMLSRVARTRQSLVSSDWTHLMIDFGLDPNASFTSNVEIMSKDGFFESMKRPIFQKAFGKIVLSLAEQEERTRNQNDEAHLMKNLGYQDHIQAKDLYRAKRKGHSGSDPSMVIAYNEGTSVSYRYSHYIEGMHVDILNDASKRLLEGLNTNMLRNNENVNKQKGGNTKLSEDSDDDGGGKVAAKVQGREKIARS